MATLEHPVDVRNLIADTVVDRIDAGGSAGKLIFYDTGTVAAGGNAVIAELTFSSTAFGAANNGVAEADTITADTNTLAPGNGWSSGDSSTVTYFEVQDSNGNTIFTGDVTDDDTGTGSIQLSSVNIGTGDTISVSSLTYTAPN